MREAMFYENRFGRWVYTPVVAVMLASWAVAVGYQHVAHSQVWLPGFLFILPGFALFLVAKISRLRQRRWISVGTGGMSPSMTACYLTGHTLMIGGFVLAFD